MDAQTTINALFAISGALGGFVLKATWDALNQLRRDMADLQKSITENYVRRDDFREHTSRVLTMLDKIFERLEEKADK